MNHKVSLYIPCYNAERTIERCIQAVFAQSYPVEEVLVIDDGSTDGTLAALKQYPVKIVSLGKNFGLAWVRNTAFKQAENEFVASLDADCIPDKDWLSNLMQEFDNKQKDYVAGVGGRLKEGNVKGIADSWRTLHMRQDWGENKVVNPPYLAGSNTVFRREIVIDLGLYWLKYKTNYEDVDLSERIICYGYKLLYIPQAVVTHQKKDSVKSLLKNNVRWNWYARGEARQFKKLFFLRFRLNTEDLLFNLRTDIRQRSIFLAFFTFLVFIFSVLQDYKSLITVRQNDSNII